MSIGASHNILLARLATRKAKPAGSYHLKEDDIQQFLCDLTVSDLPNFGWATCKKIEEEWGTTSCGDLLDKPKSLLKATLGDKTGETLYGFLRGVDNRKLEPHKERKSVSAEVNVSAVDMLYHPRPQLLAHHSIISCSMASASFQQRRRKISSLTLQRKSRDG